MKKSRSRRNYDICAKMRNSSLACRRVARHWVLLPTRQDIFPLCSLHAPSELELWDEITREEVDVMLVMRT